MAAEQDTHHELHPEQVTDYAATFILRTDCYPLQLDNGSYAIVKKLLTHNLIAAHLRGRVTLGVFALAPENCGQWLCIDADWDDQWKRVLTMARLLATQGVTPYLELSRRGGHLWLFTERVPGRDLRRFGKQLLADYAIERVELYPKQDELRTGPGSFVRLPLGIHRMTHRRYGFVTLKHQALATTVREQVAILAHPQRVPPRFFEHVLARAPMPKPTVSTPLFAQMREEPQRSWKRKKSRDGMPSDRIKTSISVADFVRRYVELNDAGRGRCPFHDDEHASFAVSDQGNYWHCFAGCGGGSIIDFWMRWRQVHGQDGSFTATITALANMLLD